MTSLTIAIAALCVPFGQAEGVPEQPEIDVVAPVVAPPPPGIEPTDITSEYELKVIETDKGTFYKAGPVRTEEVLPEGYVRPTAPGAIEIKHYPSVRRAEINGDGQRDNGMWAQNTGRAFWPLFRHINTREIPMTAPVEIDYHSMNDQDERDGWSMSFLYRSPGLGPDGQDGDIVVYDTEPVTVISLGVRSDLMAEELVEAIDTLEAWVEASDEWTIAGSPRTFGYNGPSIWRNNRWWEVQIPIAPKIPSEMNDAP